MDGWVFTTGVWAQADNPALIWMQYLPFAMIAVLFYVVFLRPQQREQQTRQAMLDGLKKNDRVLTIGGMIGTITNFSADGKEVTLKVDEAVRIRFRRVAIQEKLNAETADPPAAP